jgi:hypothetical protein
MGHLVRSGAGQKGQCLVEQTFRAETGLLEILDRVRSSKSQGGRAEAVFRVGSQEGWVRKTNQ